MRSGGSDAYCAKCDNVCYRFSDKSSEEISLGTCLEASIVDSSPTPEALELACDPNTDPFTCAYTSEGTPGKGISDCQIETCCKDCVNHEDAAAQGKGTVCVGSTGGLKKPDEKAYLYFLGEIPMNKKRFNEVSHSYKDALQSLTGAREVKIEGVEDFKLCKLPKKWSWDKTQTYCTLDETHEPNEGDEEWATIADFRSLFCMYSCAVDDLTRLPCMYDAHTHTHTHTHVSFSHARHVHLVTHTHTHTHSHTLTRAHTGWRSLERQT